MRKYYIVLFVLVAFFAHADGQGTDDGIGVRMCVTTVDGDIRDAESFAGRWWLCYLEEAGLPLNITFQWGGSGVEPLLYSPMQSSKPIKPSKWSYVNDTLRFTDGKTGVRLTLAWRVADSCFVGTFRQGLLREDVVFSLSGGMFEARRPQEPKRPFPYIEEEVVVVRKKAGVTLTGTLTLPEGEGPFPAVVLVSGSGQQNRDEELIGHKPFLVLSDYLTRHGIAVLRYDDRGVGGSTGEVATATTLDYADDAEAMFKQLQRHKKIDSKRVGIVGHSEGAAIACVVASRNRRVGFVVMMAGQAGTGAKVLLEQNEKIMRLNGVPDNLVERHLSVLRDFFAVSDTMPESEYQETLKALCEKYSRGLDKEERRQAALRDIDAIGMARQFAMPWMKAFVAFDNGDYLWRVRCPLLALNGTKDCQVVVENLKAIDRATMGKAETMRLEGLNHLFQHCETGKPSEYMMIEETMAEEAMRAVERFVNDESSRKPVTTQSNRVGKNSIFSK